MFMEKVFAIGIDPGQTGAMAVFEKIEGEFYLRSICDFMPKVFIIAKLNQCFKEGTIQSACIELVHSAPGQGVASTFKFGANFGWWIGVLDAFLISYTFVSPQRWQGKLFKDYKSFNGSLKGTTKEVSLLVAKGLFNRDKDSHGWFERKKDHGRSDASLIGWYGILEQC